MVIRVSSYFPKSKDDAYPPTCTSRDGDPNADGISQTIEHSPHFCTGIVCFYFQFHVLRKTRSTTQLIHYYMDSSL